MEQPAIPDPAALQCHPADSVGIALGALAAGGQVMLGGTAHVLRDAIPAGHTFALRPHAAGEVVRRYGEPIGRATRAIAPGEHVHTHNLATALAGERHYVAAAPGGAVLTAA